MIHGNDNMLRAQALEAYEAISSLDRHGETIRLILTEASLLGEKYRCVRRHDVPHVKEIAGLLDLLWQEVEMASVKKPADASAFPQIKAEAAA
jgi:hypothetical protein